MEIPTFENARKSVMDLDDPTPLDYFIYCNEPTGNSDTKIEERLRFRTQLENVLRWANTTIVVLPNRKIK